MYVDICKEENIQFIWVRYLLAYQKLEKMFTSPTYQRNPQTRTSSLVAEILAATGLLGIVEMEKNIFYVLAGNTSATSLLSPIAGSFFVVESRSQYSYIYVQR